MDLSIIIVNYQTYECTKNVINSILKYNYSFSYEIIVTDNASGDDSLEKLEKDFPSINFIASNFNKGFAYGNNIAIKQASGRYILLLNSDTLVYKDSLSRIFNLMESCSDIGACGCRLLLKDGTLDKACRRSFPNPKNAFYRLFHIPTKSSENNYNLDLNDYGVYEIDCLSGAFMFIRKEALDEVGLLDETFFMYGEDIDLCYRIKEKGWKIYYYGKSTVTHFKGSSSKKKKAKLIYEFYRAMYIYYNKHNKGFFLFNWVVYLGIAILCVVKLILNFFKRK